MKGKPKKKQKNLLNWFFDTGEVEGKKIKSNPIKYDRVKLQNLIKEMKNYLHFNMHAQKEKKK